MSTKTISLTQLSLLEKCLGMLGSSHDAEALTAARKADKILKDNGFTWAELLRKQVGVTTVTYEAATSDDEATIIRYTNEKTQRCLDALRGKNLGKFTSYIESLDNQWSNKRYLTILQRKALYDAYDRHVRE